MADISPVRHRTPTKLTSSHSSRAHTMSAREQLLKLLDQGSDVILVFTGADGAVEEVPANSQTLQQWSEVLAEAISTDRSSSSSKISISRIPMDGTSKDDWLLAMEFIYPVVPLPAVTWDSLEALLQLSDKYGMPALMDRVSTFVKYHKSELKLQPGKLSVWRWIEMLDRYNLSAVTKDCIEGQSDVPSLVEACPPDTLSSLSSGTMQHLFRSMKPWLPRPCGKAYCYKCRKITDWSPASHFGRTASCALCKCYMPNQ